jgi:16S rRNA (uracil1498-N3)-methyltransferase
VLPLEEAEHLSRVLRLTTGHRVHVFDGRGCEFIAEVATASKSGAILTLVSQFQPPSEPRVHITLCQSVLKGDAMDDVVRDATMVGASAIVPVVASRAELSQQNTSRKRQRWQRIAVSSAKQCGRAVVPVVGDASTLEQALTHPGRRIMLVEPATGSGTRALAALAGSAPARAAVYVGPEGGWTAEEIATARDGEVELVTLGPRTLRADAVAVVALPLLLHVWDA